MMHLWTPREGRGARRTATLGAALIVVTAACVCGGFGALAPTATPVPTETATPTIIPTETLAPTVTPTPTEAPDSTPEALTYLDAMFTEIAGFAAVVGELDGLAAEFSDNPLVADDPAWSEAVDEQLRLMQGSYDAMAAIEPPAEVADAHADFLAGTQDCVDMFGELFDNFAYENQDAADAIPGVFDACEAGLTDPLDVLIEAAEAFE
jgi:hypothetical protein